ncbi:MAG: DUF2163 domain-containing protein [Thiobacillus sp.]|nr:DUF2163 domain-containing protein [Thiobacillus sp.]
MKPAVADPKYKIHCLRIVPLWGDPVYLTDYPRDVVIGANTYQTDSGYQFSGYASEANMSPGVMDLEGIAGIAGIDRDEIVSGVFDNARVYAFATTWTAPVVDEEPLGVAIMGKAIMMDDRYKAELMMLVDVLNQSVGNTYTPGCQKEFGGQGYAGCMVDLAPITVTGTLTSVTSNAVFRDSTRAEAADYFGAGTVAFTTGANAGLKPHKIKEHAADGTITLHEPFHYAVAVGDAYVWVPGCRRRLEDCRDKWNNILNGGMFSFVPTQSTYTQVGGN